MLSLIKIFVGIAVAALGGKAEGSTGIGFVIGGLALAIWGLKDFFGF